MTARRRGAANAASTNPDPLRSAFGADVSCRCGDEELLGKSAGYPIGNRANWYYEESVRVGSFSNLDRILPHYTLEKAASPLPLPKAASEPASNRLAASAMRCGAA